MGMLLFVASASAAPFLLSTGPETAIAVDRAGNWARAVPTDEGWSFFFASGGDYWHAPLDDALVPDLARTRPLTGRSDLTDHAITRCPDGTFLHASSYTVNQPDDSVVAHWYDADLAPVDTVTIVEGAGDVITRDMPVVCGETFHGLGLFDTWAGTTFAALETGEAVDAVVLDDAPMMTGSGWVEDDGSLWTIGHEVQEWGAVGLRGYDAALELHTSIDLALVPAPLTAYWSQGLVRVGDYAVVAFMARDESEGWQLQDGNVWLAVFDADWNVVETRAVTSYAAPVGAMQPGLAVKGDQLLVTYTYDTRPYAVPVTFDADLAGADADPAAGEPLAAGCAGNAAGAGALLFPLLFRARRRR